MIGDIVNTSLLNEWQGHTKHVEYNDNNYIHKDIQ